MATIGVLRVAVAENWRPVCSVAHVVARARASAARLASKDHAVEHGLDLGVSYSRQFSAFKPFTRPNSAVVSASTSTASGFSMQRWIVRLSGRAPNTGS